jgi:hypothetical protein
MPMRDGVFGADAEGQWRPTVLFALHAAQHRPVDVLICEVSMYQRIVKKRITSVFERLGKGDCEYALSEIVLLPRHAGAD